MLRLSKNLPFLLWLVLTSSLYGASVEKVNKAKGTVMIDAGKKDGLSKGDKVCFFDDNGKKAGCGIVKKLKKNAALIKVDKKAAKKIKEGFATDVKGGSDGGGGGGSKGSKLKFAYILTPMTPARYQKLSYLPPAGATADTLWTVTEKATNSFVGFGAEYEMPLSKGNALGIGARLRLYREFTSQSDYDPANLAQYVEVNQKGTAFGLWADYYFLKAGSFRLGAGADIDLSTQNFAAGLKTDDGGEDALAEATTKATVISLRTVAAMDLYLDPIGFHIGANVLLPLTTSKSGSANVTDTINAPKLTVDANDDLIAAINHKSSFGLELFLAAYLTF